MQVVVSGQCVTRMPVNLNWEGGATVPYSTSLVWAALVTRGGLTPDQAAGARVLVLDCVTDTGVLATQLATMWVSDIRQSRPGSWPWLHFSYCREVT